MATPQRMVRGEYDDERETRTGVERKSTKMVFHVDLIKLFQT